MKSMLISLFMETLFLGFANAHIKTYLYPTVFFFFYDLKAIKIYKIFANRRQYGNKSKIPFTLIVLD